MSRHLIMLSGGPDSALALKESLTLYDDPVVALHVSLRYLNSKYEKELLACHRQVDYCKTKYRNFDFHIAAVAPHNGAVYSDVPMLGAFAAMVCNQYKDIDHIWIGEDDVADTDNTDEHFYHFLKNSIYPARYAETNLVWTNHPTYGTNRNKQKIREDLGEDLWNLSWSCRTPKFDKPCNECESCVRRNATHAPTD